MNELLLQVSKSEHFRSKCSAQRIKMATLKIRMVIGMIAMLIGGLSLNAVAQNNANMPAQQKKNCRIAKNGATVNFTVAGKIPAGAELTAVPVERVDVDGSPMLAAYDITLMDNGKEWQPAYGQPTQVTITDPNFGNGKSLDIFHEGPEGREYVASVVSVNNTVTFTAKHFSVYVVGNTDNSRLVVMFIRAYNPYNDPNSTEYESPLASEHQNYSVPDTVCMLVKRADTVNSDDNLKTLIYAPGPGYMYPGVGFFGWAGTPDYTTDPDEQMTIHDVRDSVYQRLLAENSFSDLDTLKFFPVLLCNHNVYYRSSRSPKVVIGVDAVLYRSDSSNIRPYIVNESYVPEDLNENFNGWKLMDGDANITYGIKESNELYLSGDSLNIKGDLTFIADISYGYWMTFDENGKGATYTAPIFLKSPEFAGQTGDKLSDNIPEDPTRFGYSFGGWYADADTTVPFVFTDGYLTQDTCVYAKWIPNVSANYTVMVWRQNLARDGYDLVLSYSDSGNVGQTITDAAGISTGTVGDLTYVNVLGNKLGGIAHVQKDTLDATHNILHATDPFAGFTLSTANPIHDTVVTPEGQSVLDIYFDRVRYTLKLYVTQTNLNGTGNFRGAGTGSPSGNKILPPFNSLAVDTNETGGNGIDKYLGVWSVVLDSINRVNGELPANYVVNGNNRYYYHTITAYYGEEISDQWISYSNIQCNTSSEKTAFVSWILMPWAKSWVSKDKGGNTLKGEVSVMDEKLLGNLADSTGNLITARYGSYKNWYICLYLQDLQGNFPSVPNDTIYARSDGSLENNKAKAPSVLGYRYNGTTTWAENGEGDGGYIIRHYYVPQNFDIIYMDGNYVNGNEQSLQNKKRNELHAVSNIPYGSDISLYAAYSPDLPEGEYGYVFEGWHADEACTQPYVFDKMPLGGVRVYAKWRQVQYRVFLHPQAGHDHSLNWGSESQAMNFRVSYGDKVSPPMFGQRDLYTFGGWYSDPECSVVFDPRANPLNEYRVTADYDKYGEDKTDLMDKWGDLQNTVDDPRNPNGPNGAPYNSDIIGFNGGDRFWITKKLDLYAQWRYKFDGAEGAMVEYVCASCVPSSMPVDTNLYLDKSKVVSMPGSTPSSPDSIFTHWIIQRWSTDEGKYVDSIAAYPGGPFILDLTAARRQQITPDSATYTFRLRANLEPVTAKRTFIVWYRNIEDDPLGRSDTVRLDAPDTTFYNREVSIPHPGSREGYVFKGWYRKNYWSETGKADIQPEIKIGNDTTHVNFLWYNPEDNHFYSASTFDAEHLALGVAADQQTPYHFLYAVWEPIVYTVRFNPNVPAGEEYTGKMDYEDFTYNEEKNLYPNAFVWPCHKFLGWTFTSDNSGDTLADQQLVKNLSLTDHDTVDLYAVWETTAPTLTLHPDSATCINPGSLTITVNNEVPSYHYMVYGLDITQTPAVETADPVWEATLDDQVTVPNLDPGRYRVKVVTATGCALEKDTTIFVKPEEITSKDNSMTFCGHSTFSIVPSNNPNVKYLWSDPIITPSDADVTVTPGANSTTPTSNISGTLINNSGYTVTVTYEVYPILGNCPPGLIELPISVGVATPNYEISLSGPTEDFCAGSEVTVTATVNNAIYNDAYTLHWMVNGDTTDRTLPAQKDTAKTTVSIPADLCEGSYTVEVYYVNDDNFCQVNASTSINVVMNGWTMPSDGGSTITCVTDTLPPHLLNPSVMPNVTDGCGNTLSPTLTGRTKNLGLHDCSGTVTYTYQYTDCTGETKYWRYVYTIEPVVPVLTINGPQTSVPAGNCRHRIPALDYTLEGCGNITVTQDPIAGYEISQGDNPQDITVTLTATDACGTTVTDVAVVTIPAKPTITIDVTPSTVCPGTPITLSAEVTGTDETPVWTSNPSTGVFSGNTFTSDVAGNYTLTASVGNMADNCLVTSSKAVTVNPPVTLSATDTTQTVCKGEPIKVIHVSYTAANVSVSGLPAGVGFNDDPIDPNINGTPTEAGTFHYTITATSNKTPQCGVKTVTGTITVTETGDVIPISSDSLCEESTATLVVSSTPGSTYAWKKNGVDLEATTRTLIVSEAGTYSVTVTSPHGMCISTGSITLTKHETKRDTLRRTVCDVKLPYTWDHVTFEAAGALSDTLVSVIGCDSIVTRELTVVTNPVVELADIEVCPNVETADITAIVTSSHTADFTYAWSGDLTVSSTAKAADQLSDTATVQIPDAPGSCGQNYPMSVTVTDDYGCEATANNIVAVKMPANPVIASLPDTNATAILNCTYKMPDLSAFTLHRTTVECGTPTFVSQSIASGTEYPQTAFQQTIEVTVTVKDDCNNTQTATVYVIIPAKLSVSVNANPATICLGSSSTLTATPANATGVVTYDWTPSTTLNATDVATVTATPTAAGDNAYTVNVQDVNGCSNTANVTVVVNDTVKLSADNLTQNICLGSAITTINITAENATISLDAPAAAGMTLSDNTITGTPTTAGTYNFTITATSDKTPACQVKTLTGTIVVKDLTVSATGSKSNCDNKSGSASVTASNGFEPYTYSYAYKYPSATHNTNVNLTDVNNLNTPNPTGLDTAVYVVTVTDANGCSKTAEFTVGLTNNLTVEVSAEPQHICSGGSFVITPTAPAGTHYSWNPPAQNPACSPDCDYVSGTAAGADQSTVHGENLVNNYTSTVVLTYTVVPTFGICVGASMPVTVAVDVTTHPIPPITVRDTTVCANVGNVDLIATFANVTAAVNTVSWKFLTDSVAHPNAVSSSDLTDNYTAAVPATPCNDMTYPYVVYYSDEYGCKSQRSANIIVSMPATFTITGGTDHSTIECVADTVAPHLISPSVMPTVEDACENDISDQWTLARPTNTVDCEGTMKFVYTYKNCDNKTTTWTYTYTIKRATPPAEVNGPVATTKTVECVENATAPTTLPEVKDVCGNTLTNPSWKKTENITDCEGTVTYTYTYKDCVDSQFVWKYIYTIDRTTKPTVNASGIEASKTVACVDSAKVPTTIPKAKSKCGETLTGVLTATTDNPTSLTCEGTRTYTYTYTDCAGNTATWDYVYTITKQDFTLPANGSSNIACATDTVMPTPPSSPATYCGDLTVSGPVRGGNYDGCSGTKTYTWTYTDCSGRYTHDWTYTYNIAKPAAPILRTPWPSNQSDVNACYAGKPAFPTKAAIKALYTASCSKTLTVDSVETVVKSSDCDWEIRCEYTITDECNSVSRTITYKGGDQTAPVITGTLADITVTGCSYDDAPDAYADAAALASALQGEGAGITDNCSAISDLTLNVSDGEVTGTCAKTFTRSYTVTDLCGKTSNAVEQTITIAHSTAPAEVDGPVATSSTVECIADATAPTTLPTVKDVCGNTLTAPTPVEGGTYTDCQGTKTFTYTYKDCANKEFVWTYTYNIVRSTAPAEVDGPVATSSTVECIADATAPTSLPLVKDVCSNTIDAPMPEVIDNPTTITCGGTRTYKYTYTDCAGKTFVWSYVYTILPPVLTFTNDGTLVDIENVNACYSTALATQLRTDAQVKAMYSSNCDKTITVSHVDAETKTDDCDWMITRTFTITDGCNTENKVQKISGSDNTAPTFTVPAAITVCRESDGTYTNAILPVNTGDVTDAADACSTPTVGYTDGTPTENADGTLTIVRTWKATDACGKYTEKQQTITVNPLPTLTVSLPTQTITYGESITPVVLTNTYSTVAPPTMPDGFTYNPSIQTITADMPHAGTYTITATATSTFTPNCGTVVKTIQVIVNKKALLIELDSTKVYDGTKFTVTYDQLYTTGFVADDHLASGNMWTESDQSVQTNYSGIHVGQYENHDGFFSAPMAIVGYVDKSGFSVKDGSGTDVTASYVPTFDVKLRIIPRPITITAATDSKQYDGTLLVNGNHSITAGTLASGDSYTATVTGKQLCKGWSYNTPSGAVITRGTENVNHDYQISYVKGTLTVTDVDPSNFICPTAETFLINDCETSTSITIAGEPTVIGVAAGQYTVVNNLVNPLSVGPHTITWSLLDACGYEVGSCTQVVTVDYKPCTGVTWQGHPYDAVRIGSQCWFTENLQWNTGSAVAYDEDAANVGKFGYLYTWYTAVGVPENDNTTAPTTQNDDCGNPYVQGICPPGWAVGSQADYDLLNTTPVNLLKDPSTEYWQSGYEGTPGGSGFDARGGGWYNSALSRYEDIMTGYHFWNSDSNPGTTVNSSTIVYYCDEILTVQAQKTDKMSVRCIRKKANP